jgi:hypothetical protein
MYISKCKWCNQTIEVKTQPMFALHIANCESNPSLEKRKKNLSLLYKGKKKVDRIKLERVCPKCESSFEVLVTESEIKRDSVRKYCSRKCANSRDFSDESKEKKRISAINSEKVKIANSNTNRNYRKAELENSVCLHCNGVITHNKNRKRKYHKDCWLKCSGGVKKGSSRGKSGWYKGYWCDSSYELAFLIFCLENSIEIERNKKGFYYLYEGKESKFYPDFIVDGKYIEIKNFISDLTDAKIEYFPYKIDVIYKDGIGKYLEYAKNKYGKNFISLYDVVEDVGFEPVA